MTIGTIVSPLTNLSGKEWIQHTISWFHLHYRNRTQTELTHPAKYPEELPMRFIELLTKEGEWVLDPFAGVGSTLFAARQLHRNAIGIEITPHYSALAKKQLAQTTFTDLQQRMICGDSFHFSTILQAQFPTIPQFQLVVTSPPYWNMITKSRGGSDSAHKKRKQNALPLTYSTLENDLGNIKSYTTYLDKMEALFASFQPYLTSTAHIVLVMQNFRNDDGEFIPLAWDVAYRLRKYYILCQEQIWCQKNKKAGIWGFPSTYISNVHHQYCIILKNKQPENKTDSLK